MTELDGFHLPGLPEPAVEVIEYATDDSGPLRLRRAVITPSDLRNQIEALLAARERGLAHRPVAEIAAAVDRVAARLLDPGDPLRAAATEGVAAATGESRAMTELILDRMAADWRLDSLERLLHAELEDPRALDGFVDRPAARTRSRALGAELALQISSGNVPGVSVTSLIRSLLVKSAVLAKTASGEPVLTPLFARTLAEEDEALGSCVAVAYWPGGDGAMERVAMEGAGIVIAYGGAAAIDSIRQVVPAGTRFLAYGHHVSFGIVAREALTPEGAADLAADAAMAAATFDQHGCVSPHLFYVESGGETTPAHWARLLAFAMDSLQQRLPRGRISTREAAAIVQARGTAEVSALAGSAMELYASKTGTEWTVIFDADATFTPSCLNRLVRVKPVDSLGEIVDRVRPLGAILQTVGVAGPEDRIRTIVPALAALGASRIAPIAEMPWPSPSWRHDGRPPIGDLVRWCDWD